MCDCIYEFCMSNELEYVYANVSLCEHICTQVTS